MTKITEQQLKSLYDYEAENTVVQHQLVLAAKGPHSLMRFLAHYTNWNGYFGAGVASLAGKIGRSRGLFMSPDMPIRAIADRSVLVASYFFDAARDEFDDRDTLHRDTHRCLAQAMLLGLVGYGRKLNLQGWQDQKLDELADTPLWLAALNERVAIGYGTGSPDTLPVLFRAMGYHVGSEVLADQEFSVIDQTLRDEQPELLDYLQNSSVEIGGEAHGCYQWVGLHSGHGGGAEADHFQWAMQGVERAFAYIEQSLHSAVEHQFELGYLDFCADHAEFFKQVNN